MTKEQFENCKQCLNRKKGVIEIASVCNIKGKSMVFENTCNDFDLDSTVVVGAKNKIDAIRPNEQRAKLAQLFIWLVMALDIISIFSSYMQYNLLQSLQNDEFVTDEMLNSNDTREQIIGVLYLIVFISSAVTFIQWFRRAYYNLNIRTNCNHSEGWAAGSWFVPILCLFRPYQIMKEMWQKTTLLIASKTADATANSTLIIGLWWTLWIVSNYIGKYVLKSAFNAETIENFINSTIGDMTISILGIPLAIATVMMIKAYAFKEEKISELEQKEN
tara:strand:- start:43802 stop:44626 length:825 start_codon:yes stop_codon:yes gene_type:complete